MPRLGPNGCRHPTTVLPRPRRATRGELQARAVYLDPIIRKAFGDEMTAADACAMGVTDHAIDRDVPLKEGTPVDRVHKRPALQKLHWSA
ncbi:hypothetical protein HKCCE2091_07015 [Rhodobacterales bacterium HKCCE2091]|nr:hypothetical protein [Rhodobacterales bacterium HKCCE2091]